ncbi:MAG: hypothetical protein AAGC71_17745 [Pseudomonadota bacterium]
MDDIVTTNHPVLQVGDRHTEGILVEELGHPNVHIQDWRNSVYNTFVSPDGDLHFYYLAHIAPPDPFGGRNDSRQFFGLCSEQGQCVQAWIQVSFDSVSVPSIIVPDGLEPIVPANIDTVPSRVDFGYTDLTGQQRHDHAIPEPRGGLPKSLPVKNMRGTVDKDCLDNNNEVTRDRTPGDNTSSNDGGGEGSGGTGGAGAGGGHGPGFGINCGHGSGHGGPPGQEEIADSMTTCTLAP